MRFGTYMVGGEESAIDGESSIKMAIRPSANDAHLIRKCLVEELEAINDYMERADKCENDIVRKVMLDIAEEERVHFGEFELLLEAVDPIHEPSEEEGEEEIQDMYGEYDNED